MISRKTFLAAVAALSASIAVPAFAESYPSRPVTIIVPFPAGGPQDAITRNLAHRLQAALRQPFIVDNRPGATGMIGTVAASRAKADGYTLLFTSNSAHIIAPLLRKNPGFDPHRDFDPVQRTAVYPFCLTASTKVQASTTQELVTLAKAQPGKLFYGSLGEGSGNHLMTELFKQRTEINLVHVPYKGTAQATTAVMADEVQVYFDSIGSAKSLIDSGRLRAFAVTSEKRSALLPDVPTLAEAGVAGQNPTIWLGILAPKGTPQPILNTLQKEIRQVLETDAEIKTRIRDLGAESSSISPQQIAASMKSEQESWKALIERLQIQLE